MNKHQLQFFKSAGSQLTAQILLLTLFILGGSLYINLKISWSNFDAVIKSEFKTALNVQENFIEQAFEFSESWAEHMAKEPKLHQAFLLKNKVKRQDFLREHGAVLFKDTFVLLLDSNASVLYCASGIHKDRVLWQHEAVRLAFSTSTTQNAIINEGSYFSLISVAPVFASETDKTLLGVVIVGKKITHQFAQKIQRNTLVDVAIIRDRAIMATTLTINGEHLLNLPLAYTDYLALLKHPGETLEIKFLGKKYFAVAKKLQRMDSSSGSILLLKPRQQMEEIERRLIDQFLYLALVAFILTLFISLRISRRFTHPIEQLIDTTYRIAKGEAGLRVNHNDLKKDFARLAINFNFMVDTIEEKNTEIKNQNSLLETKVLQRTQQLKKLTVAVEQSPNSIVITDINANIEYINPRFTEVTGYSIEEIVGKNMRLLNSWLTPKETIKDLWIHLKQGQVWRGEFVNQHKNGEYGWEKAVIAPIRDEQGQVINYVAVKEDITDSKQVEEKNARLGQILEDSLNEIYLFDAKTLLFTLVNKGARDNLGYSMEELKALKLLNIQPNYSLEKFEKLVKPLRRGMVQYLRFKTLHQRKDCTLYPVEIHLQLTQADTSSVFVAMVQNISERNEAELLLKTTKEQAEKANLAKSQFIANMSHELRTPLNAILGFSQILAKSDNLTLKQQQNLQIINRSGDHLLSLINDVLDISKIEAGQITLQKTNFNLYRLLKELASLFQEKLVKQQLSLTLNYDDDLPEYCCADKTKLRQILVNLISNAIKFTAVGGISLRVSHQLVTADTIRLYFEVEDTGCGIATEELALVFKDFVQTSSGLQLQKGTGLGLAISQRFVQLMAGEITVHSQLNKGSIFKFTAIVNLVMPAEVNAEQNSLEIIGLVETEPKYRILVVDDIEFNRLLLVELLSPLGFEVKQAENGQQAIECWKDWQPQCILMDMRMPVMDGYQASQQIKLFAKQAELQPIIIAVTASAFEDKKQKILDAGCDGFISKPFRNNALFSLLQKHLGVEFLYKELLPKMKVIPLPEVSAESFAKLPNELRTALKEAITIVDIEKIGCLLEIIAEENQQLSDIIQQKVDDYQYEDLMELL